MMLYVKIISCSPSLMKLNIQFLPLVWEILNYDFFK